MYGTHKNNYLESLYIAKYLDLWLRAICMNHSEAMNNTSAKQYTSLGKKFCFVVLSVCVSV